jgi:GT2 family glycosyltransferase
MKKNLVSITIANWNSGDYIERCLKAIKSQTYPHIEILVVDNGSEDSSLSYIERNFADIKVIKNGKNKGFSKAHNQAIAISLGEYVLPLNFDVFLEPVFVSEMVSIMERDPAIGIISGKLYRQISENKSSVIDSTGITMKHCFMRPRGAAEKDIGQYDNPDNRIVFGACGAAPFYRRAMLEDIMCDNEFFDEDFVNYVEDVDLSWRSLLRGWQCVYSSKAAACHERGATRKNNNRMRIDYSIYGFRNRYCSMVKNITRGYWKKNRIKIISKELIFLFVSVSHISRLARLKSFYWALKMLGTMLRKRKIIQSRVRITDERIDSFLCYNSLCFREILANAFAPRRARLQNSVSAKNQAAHSGE